MKQSSQGCLGTISGLGVLASIPAPETSNKEENVLLLGMMAASCLWRFRKEDGKLEYSLAYLVKPRITKNRNKPKTANRINLQNCQWYIRELDSASPIHCNNTRTPAFFEGTLEVLSFLLASVKMEDVLGLLAHTFTVST